MDNFLIKSQEIVSQNALWDIGEISTIFRVNWHVSVDNMDMKVLLRGLAINHLMFHYLDFTVILRLVNS